MTTLQMALIGAAVVLLLGWWWLRRRGDADADEGSAQSDRIDTITGWPPQATRVLSTPERLAFGMLVQALPDYMVLAQVPVSRFLNVPKRNSYADWLRRVGYQCVDFAICDMAAQVIAVVELQAAGPNNSERARKRSARMARALQAAGIPLQVWRADALPSVSAARAALLPKAAPLAAPPVAAAVAAKPAPVATGNPFDDSQRDSSHDERIELEPPPSTWFDDLESEPMPLRKN